MILKLAWRNIWRNKRRTLITALAVMLAVFFASMLRSIQKGTWDNVVDSSVSQFFGYGQLHAKGYWEDQVLDKSFEDSPSLRKQVVETQGISGIIPRIESFALASVGNVSSGVMVLGIDPEAENEMADIKSKMIQGEYLTTGDNAVIIGEGLAEKLRVSQGDTIVLISQGYRGANAAGKYPIKGIFKYGMPDLNKRLVYLPLALAQQFYGADKMATSYVLAFDNKKDIDPSLAKLSARIDGNSYEVQDWKEMIPEILEARAFDEGANKIILGILYLLITFGIFGTILMMIKEREYEFGVLTSIGMKRWQLSLIIWLETLFIGILGVILGVLFSAPIVSFLAKNPIDLSSMGEEAVTTYENMGMEPFMYTTAEWPIFLNQAWIVLVITTLLAIYPLLKISRLEPVKAMRG